MTFVRYALLGLGLLGVLAGPSAVAAATLDLSLSDHAARLGYTAPLTQTGLDFDLAALHHEDDGDVFSAGLHVVDDAAGGREPFTVGIGGRAYTVEVDGPGPSGSALAIGGYFRYILPTYNRLAFSGDVHFAPSVTSFGDAERFYELAFKAEYRVLRRASVYLGARRVRMDFDGPGDASIDRGVNVGIGIEF